MLRTAQGGGAREGGRPERDIPSEEMEAPESLKSSEPIWMGKTRSCGSILGILLKSWTVEAGVRISCWTPRDGVGVPAPLSTSPLLDFATGIVEGSQRRSSTDGRDQTVSNWSVLSMQLRLLCAVCSELGLLDTVAMDSHHQCTDTISRRRETAATSRSLRSSYT